MAKQQKSVHKKSRRGRPKGRTYRETIPVRLTPEAVEEIDEWIDRQDEPPSRSEAIRKLVALGLRRS